MKLLAAHIPPLAHELTELCAGLVVKDLAALPPRDLLLVLDSSDRPGPSVRRLRLSASRLVPRLHVQLGRTFRHGGPLGRFYAQVQADLVGSTLQAVRAVAGDRIAILEFRGSPSGEPRALLLELFGPAANLYLLGKQDQVLACLVPPPTPKAGQTPRIVVGEPWAAPAGAGPVGPQPDLEDSFPTPSDPAPQAGAPLSWRIESALGPVAEQQHIEEGRKDLSQRLQRKIQSTETRLKGLHDRRLATQDMQRVQQDGELLKAAIGQWKRGAKTIVLADWFDEGMPERSLELDPKLDPQANVQRYFARFKKLQRAAQNVHGEIEELESRLARLQAALAEVDTSDAPWDLEQTAVEQGLLDPRQVSDERKKKAPAARLPYRTFEACDGSEIRVGKSARDNDDLTFRHARGSDLWLHTADAPGSHVILRAERQREPAPEAIVDAALLAVYFSPLKEAGRASVHVVHQKQVQKPKGAKPGLVTLAGGKRIVVRADEERLKRLLRTQG